MEGNNVVSVADFMQHLKENNLVIVSKTDVVMQSEIAANRKQLMKCKSLTFKQVLDNRLLPLTTKQGIESWITRKKIKETEIYTESNGVRRIMTSAIRRLGYED